MRNNSALNDTEEDTEGERMRLCLSHVDSVYERHFEEVVSTLQRTVKIWIFLDSLCSLLTDPRYKQCILMFDQQNRE